MRRRQFSSCDPCRQSKRRCEPASQGSAPNTQRNVCGNCVRLHLNCTYSFVSSKKVALENRKRGHNVRRVATGVLPSPVNSVPASEIVIGDEIFATFGNTECSVLEDWMEPFSDPVGLNSLEPWTKSIMFDGNEPILQNNLLIDPAQVTDTINDVANGFSNRLEPSVEFSPLPSPQIQSRRGWTTTLSPSSPLGILNRSFESKLLNDKLFRVYKHIGFLSVSSFLGDGCNPFTKQDFDLEKGQTAEWERISSNSASSATTPAFIQLTPPTSQETLSITMLGAASFLDHFGTLYGRRLDRVNNRLAETAFEDVFHAFSIQWVHQYGEQSPPYTDLQSSLPDLAVGWWCKARSSLQKAQRVCSFKTVWAMLLFNMTTIPPRFASSTGSSESHQKKDFLNDCISHMIALRRMVIPYCENLGPDSTYANALQVCLSLFSWLAILRDSTTSMINLRSPCLESITFEPERGTLVHTVLSLSSQNA
jgi:hypothetical protein